MTAHQPSRDLMGIYDAAERYRGEGVPLVGIAGQDYGAGSSRDWVAKARVCSACARSLRVGSSGSTAPT